MSHIATFASSITDPDVIRATVRAFAVRVPGVELLENVAPRFYYSNLAAQGGVYGSHYQDIVKEESQVCEFVFKMPGPYDLGLKWDATTGTYKMVCDNELLSGSYGRASDGRRIVGEHAELFLQEYETQNSILWAESMGYPVTREVVNGVVELTIDAP